MKRVCLIIAGLAVCLSACGKDEEPAAVERTTEPTTLQTAGDFSGIGLTGYENNENEIMTDSAVEITTENIGQNTENYSVKNLHTEGFWWADMEPEEIYETIADAFVNKDAETLKSFFCKKTQNTHDLDKELKRAFGVFDGDIVSYDNEFPYLWTSGNSYRDGGMIEHFSSVTIEDVETSTGKKYWIYFYLLDICSGDESEIGVQYIEILEEKEKFEHISLFEIGDYYDNDIN